VLDDSCFVRWSIEELAVLFLLQSGAPRSFRLRRAATWGDVLYLYGSSPVSEMLSSLTGAQYSTKSVQRALTDLRQHTDATIFAT